MVEKRSEELVSTFDTEIILNYIFSELVTVINHQF